jgi:tRNA threonylcarbamoyladenosine biosynthesis protein TsaE
LTGPGAPAARLLADIGVPTAARMRALGRRLAPMLRAGDLIVLNGQLGAGKTTLVRGIGEGLNVRGPVTSPTFVIARVHPPLGAGPALVHVDAYRLSSPAEVDDLDLDADLERSVTVVEWGGGLVEGLAADWLDVTIGMPAPALGTGLAVVSQQGQAGQPGAGCPSDPGDEPRNVQLTGWGERWTAAAGSVRARLLGAPAGHERLPQPPGACHDRLP